MGLKSLPPSDRLDCKLSSGQVCLLTNDGTNTTVALAKSLMALGWKIVIVNFPKSIVATKQSPKLDLESITLSDTREQHLQQQLQAIAQQYGAIVALIHLSRAKTTSVEAKAILKTVFLLAKHLQPSLNQAAQEGRSWFVTVSQLDGKLGLGGEDIEPIIGGLSGLTKTLNWEWQSVFCRHIDLSPQLDTATAVDALVAELHDRDLQLREVGISPQGRVTLAGKDALDRRLRANIGRDAVFLVSGGGRGITAQCVVELSQHYRCKLILLGRSRFQPEPDWANGCVRKTELKQQGFTVLSDRGVKPTPKEIDRLVKDILASREITQTLQTIKQNGSTAVYLSADLTNNNLKQKLTPITQELGQITGIIHGAGVLADKLIEHKTEGDFERVYTTKITGLQNLLDCVEPQQLQHLILFSSAAGFYGNIGQADYAIANEILNKFAYQFKGQYSQCNVVSFNWGPWDSGMVTPQLREMFARRGVTVIPVDVGTKIFVDGITQEHSSTAQILVGGSLVNPTTPQSPDLKSYRIRRKLTLADNSILNDHIIGGNVVLPATFAIAWFVDTAEKLYPGYRFFSYQNYQVLKGIVFDDFLAAEYILDFQEISKKPDDELELSAVIWSKAGSTTRYNYQIELKLISHKQSPLIYNSLEAVKTEESIDLAPYKNGTLFHGARFQVIKKILKIEPDKLVLECKLPEIKEKDLGQFYSPNFQAIAADIQFQAILVLVRYLDDAASLPCACQSGEYFQNIPVGKTFYVSLKVRSRSAIELSADLLFGDRSGNVYSRVLGAKVTINKQLNSLFVPANSRFIKQQNKHISAASFVDFWRRQLGVEHPIAEALYQGLYDRFVGKIIMEDPAGFQALKQQPRLYLANHQVAIESNLFIYAVSALTNNFINAVAKIEHRSSWMGELSQQLSAYPQVQDIEFNFYFDRQDRASAIELLNEIEQKIRDRGNSLLVHVAGTRSLSCRQTIKDMSAVFIDLAINLDLPIIPVKFTGGLPVEPLSLPLNFPYGYTHQDYYLGKAIRPHTLQQLGNLERKEFVLHRLNSLGIAPEKTSPHKGDRNFDREVKLKMSQMDVSEVRAVLYQILTVETRHASLGARSQASPLRVCDPLKELTFAPGGGAGSHRLFLLPIHPNDHSPQAQWRKKFINWLTKNDIQ